MLFIVTWEERKQATIEAEDEEAARAWWNNASDEQLQAAVDSVECWDLQIVSADHEDCGDLDNDDDLAALAEWLFENRQQPADHAEPSG